MSDDKNWAPARIWLQREAGEQGSHTWCEDSVGDGDMIEEAAYVRVDAGCEVCKGSKGGVPGNENIIDGKRVCDYCHADGSYTVPPPASTNRLTDEQIRRIWLVETGTTEQDSPLAILDFARSIIAATEMQ